MTPLPVPTGAAPAIVSASLLPIRKSLRLEPIRVRMSSWMMSFSGPPIVAAVAGRPGLGKLDEDARAATDDVDSGLGHGNVGEGVGAGVAEDLVVAGPGDQRVVACVAVDDRMVGGRGAAAADDRVVAVAAVYQPLVAAHQAVVAAAAEDRVVARRRVDDPVTGAHRGCPEDRVVAVAAGQAVGAVGADQGSDVAVDDVLLLAADRPAGAGRPGLGKLDEDAGAATDDVKSALADGDVGEGVGPGAAGQVVAAGP